MNILSALAADPHLSAQFRAAIEPLPSQVQFRASCGRKRTFLSASDARQYEAGWLQWPYAMPAELSMSTPYASGWWDGQDDADARQDERMEVARARSDE